MTMHEVMRPEHEAASILIQTAPRDLDREIAAQAVMRLTGDFSRDLRFHGQLERVAYEIDRRAKESRVLDRSQRAALHFCGVAGEQGPRIAFSANGSTLLLTGTVPKELPKVSDPEWKPKYTLGADGAGGVETAPRIKQRWEKLLSGTFHRFLVFQPLVQVIFQTCTGQWATVYFSQRPRPPFQHAMLLLDPDEGDGYFIGGAMRVEVSRS